MIKLTKELCELALMGGLPLGGGGGGLLSAGREALEETFRHTDALTMLDISELNPEDIVVTVSTVGAPSAKDVHLTAAHWMTALKNFEEMTGKKIAGFISCENGAISTANGWIISALTGIPIVDAPCNGRAHPTGTMGSMGLNTLDDYVSVQSSCGGNPENYIETVARGRLHTTARMTRQCAVASGGMVGVIRNPVTAAYLAKNGAVGAISQAISIGKMFAACGSGQEFVAKLISEMDARVLAKGRIENYDLKMEGGLDVGRLDVAGENGRVSMTFFNEYMLAEQDGARLATFPDLICTLDADTGEAISTAEATNGREAYALVIPKEKLLLGAGMRQRSLFREVEELIHKDMTACNDGLFVD